MTRYALLAALLALPAGRLRAQHAGQFEAGVFGSYTRYAAAFGLADKLGGGGRLGYFFGDALGLEADVLFQQQYTVSTGGTPTTLQPLIGSASLVFNAVHASRLMIYVLGAIRCSISAPGRRIASPTTGSTAARAAASSSRRAWRCGSKGAPSTCPAPSTRRGPPRMSSRRRGFRCFTWAADRRWTRTRTAPAIRPRSRPGRCRAMRPASRPPPLRLRRPRAPPLPRNARRSSRGPCIR